MYKFYTHTHTFVFVHSIVETGPRYVISGRRGPALVKERLHFSALLYARFFANLPTYLRAIRVHLRGRQTLSPPSHSDPLAPPNFLPSFFFVLILIFFLFSGSCSRFLVCVIFSVHLPACLPDPRRAFERSPDPVSEDDEVLRPRESFDDVPFANQRPDRRNFLFTFFVLFISSSFLMLFFFHCHFSLLVVFSNPLSRLESLSPASCWPCDPLAGPQYR